MNNNTTDAFSDLRKLRLLENTINELCNKINTAYKNTDLINTPVPSPQEIEEKQQERKSLESEAQTIQNEVTSISVKIADILSKETHGSFKKLRLSALLKELRLSANRERCIRDLIEERDCKLTQLENIHQQYQICQSELALMQERLNVENLKITYKQVADAYNEMIDKLKVYVDYEPTRLDPTVIQTVEPFPRPEEQSEDSDFM